WAGCGRHRRPRANPCTLRKTPLWQAPAQAKESLTRSPGRSSQASRPSAARPHIMPRDAYPPLRALLPASSTTHTAVRLKPTSSPANILIAALLPSLEESPAERVAFPPESSNLMYGMYKNTRAGISTNPSIKDFHVWEQLTPIDPLGGRVAEHDSISNSCSLPEER